MNVPPFVPQPTEIPGNVTVESYHVRLAFIRRVAVLHFLSICAIAFLSWTFSGFPSLSTCALILGGLLAGSSLFRSFAHGARWEPFASAATLPFIMASLAGVIAGLSDLGWPTWAPGLGIAASVAYTLVCGRDLSFVGMYCLAVLVSSIAMALLAVGEVITWRDVPAAFSTNLFVTFYYVYDLGSLLSRRRLGEEVGAVVDLYRDVLNIFGYSIRSVRHWREHRIWSR